MRIPGPVLRDKIRGFKFLFATEQVKEAAADKKKKIENMTQDPFSLRTEQ